MSIIRVVDEFHGRGVAVVLEKRNVDDYGAFVVKVHRHYYDEESARAAFEAEKRRRSKRGKSE